ncbi:lysosomal alpha-glucosidase-like [Harmonia axyridis]|uniref:lysosomal alpha-glucosidase-like n=1 Tax=Harmonia axyridis TaxID=115357 RepID=UPI001E276E12|nr:lysosomal alpha-glucosidase-like [Harmonia axyridis]
MKVLKRRFIFLFIVFYMSETLAINIPQIVDVPQCANVPENERLDCYPQTNANQEECEARGCCWIEPNESVKGLPYCFYQPKAESYKFTNVTEIPDGINAFLERSSKSPYPSDVSVIQLIVTYQSDTTLRLKIIDPNRQRFETPFPEVNLPTPKTENPLYKFVLGDDKQGFKIVRRSDNTSVFDVSDLSNFIYSNQFLQITTKLPSSNIYGLGEQRKHLKLSTDWNRITLFNHDTAPQDHVNIYGTHPFYLLVEDTSNANGVFLKNSNGLELILQPSPALTYRAIGGILDFYVFLGPTPSDVLKQYQEVVGKPKMPPFWSLGFHLCRWGINDLETTKKVLQRNLDAGIPVEVQWNDLDYMDKHNDFTINKTAFAGLPEFVQDLHRQGRRYVILIDPGVSGSEELGSYPPYDRGVELDVFVKNTTDQIFIGKVWNLVSTVFPDFTHPNAYTYWKEMLKQFHDVVPFDGAWIDMNEVSNSEFPYGCPDSDLDHPMYQLHTEGGTLQEKTLCMTAKQHLGVHYDVHNLYGISEANITSRALSEILGERSFIISRSTFAGQGRYGGHWGGDVYSTWDELRYSIPHLLDFSLFGVPLMGSDICGFNDNTTEELCNRWMQLGAFYPFSRNHNSEKLRDQDPVAMGEQVVRSSLKALRVRYSLLPYLYTLFWYASQEGTTVARPLVVEFPNDPNTYDIDTTFLWGSALLIAPVLEDNPSSISVYLPKGRWYNFYNRTLLESVGESFNISTDRDTIPLFLRGGLIVPMQSPAATTEEVRKSDIKLLVALDENGKAKGNMYWDDGLSLDVSSDYTLLELNALQNTLELTSLNKGSTGLPKITSVEILGSSNGVNNKSILIDNLSIDSYPAKVTWPMT